MTKKNNKNLTSAHCTVASNAQDIACSNLGLLTPNQTGEAKSKNTSTEIIIREGVESISRRVGHHGEVAMRGR